MELPKYNSSSKKGEDGITILKRIVEEDLNWIFRPNHKENDFGIDTYFDVITDQGFVTGKSIAVQVKTGASYFKEENEVGWVYRGEMAHLNYYLNHDIPVVIVIIDEKEKKAFWCYCDPSKTEKAGDNWKITIPFKNELTLDSKAELMQYLTPVEDHISQLEHFWEMNKKLKEFGDIVFMVDKPEIENLSVENLQSGFQRLSVNPDILKHAREKVDIWIHGYDEDPRELRDIPEFRDWLDFALDNVVGWSYFLSKDEWSQFLRVIQLCKMEFKIIKKRMDDELGLEVNQVEVDLKSGVPLLEYLFHDLNTFCDEHGIPDEVNYEISGNLVEYLSGDRPPELE